MFLLKPWGFKIIDFCSGRRHPRAPPRITNSHLPCEISKEMLTKLQHHRNSPTIGWASEFVIIHELIYLPQVGARKKGRTEKGSHETRKLRWAPRKWSKRKLTLQAYKVPGPVQMWSCLTGTTTLWRKCGSSMFNNQPKVMHAVDEWQSRHLSLGFFLFLQSYAFFF